MRKFQTFFLLIFLVACSPAKNIELVEFDYEFDCSDVAISGMSKLIMSEEFNVDSWVCSIGALEDPDTQQAWYSNLLGRLSLQEGPLDVNLRYALINKLTDLDTQQAWYSNLLGLLSLQEGPINVNLWYTLINKITDPDTQQAWYSNLLGRLNLEAMNGGDVDLDIMYIIVDELTDEDLQKLWKTNIESTKALRLLNKVSG
tara:strand:+ start:34 stop:636 length:603 start_codon:yes stop_codon:yes gene_type:complete